jgi:hypothetical protein
MTVRLTAELLESFAGTFLSPLYDTPQPTPDFHRDVWDLYCSDAIQAAVAAPRNHAKSTALTHDFGLAMAVFRQEPYIMVLGSSEEMATEHLGDISTELHENEDLRREFGIKGFLSDQKTDIIVECTDGYQFRFVARGAEQKIRGRKWRGRRPGLLILDDIEDDEQVENKERRQKFYRWVNRAAKQALRDGGKIRWHGTILHEDSALAKIMKDPTWATLRYQAHRGFDDFADILWPEKFSQTRLRTIRQTFIEAGDSGGYSQEYLNDPMDSDDVFLRKEDFIPMDQGDYEMDKIIYAGADFAVSKLDHANRTSFSVAGKCPRNLLHFLDQRVGRWDTSEWIEEMFSIQARWNPDVFFVEGGVIWKSIEPTLYNEMRSRDVWINFLVITPVKDKSVRGTPLRKRMRAGGCRFDKKASWYEEFEYELRRFRSSAQATLDDQFDSAAIIAKGLETASPGVDADDFEPEEHYEIRRQDPRQDQGRSSVTGY